MFPHARTGQGTPTAATLAPADIRPPPKADERAGTTRPAPSDNHCSCHPPPPPSTQAFSHHAVTGPEAQPLPATGTAASVHTCPPCRGAHLERRPLARGEELKDGGKVIGQRRGQDLAALHLPRRGGAGGDKHLRAHSPCQRPGSDTGRGCYLAAGQGAAGHPRDSGGHGRGGGGEGGRRRAGEAAVAAGGQRRGRGQGESRHGPHVASGRLVQVGGGSQERARRGGTVAGGQENVVAGDQQVGRHGHGVSIAQAAHVVARVRRAVLGQRCEGEQGACMHVCMHAMGAR